VFPFLLAGLIAGSAAAGVVTDGTLGPGRSLAGPDFVVGEDLGKRVGDNLFHSFRQFSIRQGESATFTGAPEIRNLISRVTGGEVSSIDGLLRSEVGTADFYFINPRGVLFGPNAQLDVPAGFHVASADEVRFADGSSFRADDPAMSRLSIENPHAFGFRSASPGRLTIDGSVLNLAAGANVTLAGGDLELTGAALESAAGAAQLVAQGSATGEVRLDGEGGGGANGRLTVTDSGLYLSGDGGGQALLRAGEVRFERGFLGVDNQGERDAGRAILAEAAELAILDDSYWSANSFGGGRAGDVQVTVGGGVEIAQGGIIASDSYAGGRGGQVTLSAGALRVAGDGWEGFTGIASNSNQGATGAAGRVRIHAGSLRVDGRGADRFTGIASNTDGGAGNAGGVEVRVDGLLELVDSGVISSSTWTDGDAGIVRVEAPRILIDGQQGQWATGILSTASAYGIGQTGGIEVSGRALELRNGGEISIASFVQAPEEALAGFTPPGGSPLRSSDWR